MSGGADFAEDVVVEERFLLVTGIAAAATGGELTADVAMDERRADRRIGTTASKVGAGIFCLRGGIGNCNCIFAESGRKGGRCTASGEDGGKKI